MFFCCCLFSLFVTDCGQMSAWFFFNALGFYPVNPASGDYMIGSPIFDKVEIRLPQQSDHLITITAPGSKDKVYIERLTLDGIDVKTPIISHKDLLQGKELAFTMNHRPQTWFKDSF